MLSQDKPIISFASITHELIKVSFNKLNNVATQYQISIENTLSTKSVSEEGFTIKAVRTLSFEPIGAFEITVEFDIICKFKQESVEYYKGNLNEITAFIEKRKVEIFNSIEVGNLMSIIMSQLTLTNNYKSIVIPPFIEDKKQNKTVE